MKNLHEIETFTFDTLLYVARKYMRCRKQKTDRFKLFLNYSRKKFMRVLRTQMLDFSKFGPKSHEKL